MRSLCQTASLALVLHSLSVLSYAEVKVVSQQFDSIPHQVVQQTTQRVLVELNSGIDPTNNPQVFVDKLSVILDPVIAFDYIAKGVMGKHVKQVTPGQVKMFAQAFKLGLVSTYGKGMANFSGFEIAVLPPLSPVADQRRVVVVQEIRGGSGTNQVSYSMVKNRQGEWKVINMVLNGINLGQTFRGQFAAAVKKNEGDVVKTIAEWGDKS